VTVTENGARRLGKRDMKLVRDRCLIGISRAKTQRPQSSEEINSHGCTLSLSAFFDR
jgi:hypothetical protein